MHANTRFTGLLTGLALAGMTLWAAAGTTYHVAIDGVDDEGRSGLNWTEAFASINYAAGRASKGDTVLVDDGVYNVAGETSVTEDLTIKSVNGSAYTILDGMSGGYRAFRFRFGVFTLEGFTIKNFSTTGSGGNFAVTDDAEAYIRDCVFKDNTGGTGGVLYSTASLFIYDSVFTNNTSSAGGGAIHLRRGSLFAERTDFLSNTNTGTAAGGAIHAHQAVTVELHHCRIIGNVSTVGSGGGISIPSGTVTIRNSVISGNRTRWSGGGLSLGVAAATISNSEITHNENEGVGGASGGGGAILNTGLIENCLIAHNLQRPGQYGGGGIVANGPVTIRNCTIVYNTAAERGGGVRFRDTDNPGSVVNSIVYFNEDTFRGNHNYNYHELAPIASFWTNSITTPDPANHDYGEGAIYGTDCIVADPELDADYKPLRGISPAINAGLNQAWMEDAVDLAGNRRILMGTVDIGAYEYVPAGTVIMVR